MKKSRFLALLVLFISGLTQAQEPIIWPPKNPETLFGSDVEIIDMKLDSTVIRRIQYISSEPDYRAVIRSNGRIYPWPDDSLYYSIFFWAGDQAYLGVSGNNSFDFDSISKLDLITGIYTHYAQNQSPKTIDIFCGTQPLQTVAEKAFQSRWVIIDQNEQHYLCNLDTKDLSLPLPEGYEEWQIHDSTSDIPYLFLSARVGDDDPAALFALDKSSHQITHMGEFDRGVRVMIDSLINNQIYRLNTSYGSESSTEANYIVDLTRQRIFEIPDNGSFGASPLRIEAHTASEADKDSRCSMQVIDLITEKEVSYTLDTACWPEFWNTGGREYYRILQDGGKQASVVRVDVMTGEQTTLYTGEVEQIEWISDDERYAALILSDNGIIDTPLGPLSFNSDAVNPQLVILDLTDGKPLFETSARIEGLAPVWEPKVSKINANWVAVVGYNTSQLVHLADHSVNSIAGRVWYEIDNDWVIVLGESISEFGNVADFSIYNLETQKMISVVNLGIQESSYWLGEFEYLGDGVFQVQIGYNSNFWDPPPPLYNLAVYTLRVPEVGNKN